MSPFSINLLARRWFGEGKAFSVVREELGAKGLLRHIYFADGDLVLDVANRELFVRDRWLSAELITEWKSGASGTSPQMKISLDHAEVAPYEYATPWLLKHQQLESGLRLLEKKPY